jgi:pilus assembly protein CpaF
MILQPLFDDLDVTEITINGFNNIWIEVAGQMNRTSLEFDSEHHLYLFMKEICRDLNTDISLLQPFVNGQWRNFRVHITSEHVTKTGFLISMRRIRTHSWQLDDLQKRDFFAANQREQVEEILCSKKNILVVGPTGSGKTSFLGAMIHHLPESERCLLLEDTEELHIPNSSSNKLLTFDQDQSLVKKVELQDLVKQSLRMRPDRLIVGEIRGSEAKDLLLALSTGHSGSMGTLHANSAAEALLRLEMLVQVGAPQWSLETIRRLLFLSIQIVMVVGKDIEGKRKLISIDKVHSLESFGIVTEPYQFTTFPNSNKWDGRGLRAF